MTTHRCHGFGVAEPVFLRRRHGLGCPEAVTDSRSGWSGDHSVALTLRVRDRHAERDDYTHFPGDGAAFSLDAFFGPSNRLASSLIFFSRS